MSSAAALEIFDGLFQPDLSNYYMEFFVVAMVIGGFLGGMYLLFSGKSRIFGILLMLAAGGYAFMSWG
jgi:hypothetical protein